MQETIESFDGLPHGTKQGRLATVKLCLKSTAFHLHLQRRGMKCVLQRISAATWRTRQNQESCIIMVHLSLVNVIKLGTNKLEGKLWLSDLAMYSAITFLLHAF